MSDDNNDAADAADAAYDGTPQRPRSTTEVYYLEKNQCLKTLVVLCRGILGKDGKQLLDPCESPWKYMKVSTIKATSSDYKIEINRRWNLFGKESGILLPHPRAWSLSKVLDWLDENPITSVDDVAFLEKTVTHTKQTALDAFAASKAEKASIDVNWTGKYPYLRLIHCLIDDDDIKEAYLHRHDVDTTRMTVENRNSVDKRPPTVWEMISAKWNDKNFEPKTAELPDLHSDFILQETLFHSLVSDMTPATPEKCMGKFASMALELSRVIANYQRSGQGDGGVENENEDEGQVDSLGETFYKSREHGALDARSSFVPYSQAYLLYLWVMLEEHHLMGSTLNRLDESVAAGNGGDGVPSVIDRNGSLKGANDHDSVAMSWTKQEEMNRILIESIQELSRRTEETTKIEMDAKEEHYLKERIDLLKDKKRSLTIEILKNKKSREMVKLLNEQMEEIERETQQKTDELSKLKHVSSGVDLTTPTRHNFTPDASSFTPDASS